MSTEMIDTGGTAEREHAAEREQWVQRYLLAELDADEIAAFEGRLGRDPALAQALADGVALFSAVADLPVVTRSRWQHASAWPSRVAAAAVLLIAASLFLLLSSRSAPEGQWVARAALSDQQADQVLSLWLASVDEEADLIAAEDAEAVLWTDPTQDATFGPEVGEDGEDGEDDEWDIPEWLLLGVRGDR